MPVTTPRLRVTSATVALLLALTGCALVNDTLHDAASTAGGGTAQIELPTSLPLPDAATTGVDLAALPTVARTPHGIPDYDRSAFGSAWADIDRNGCNQRDDVLLRDAVPGSVTTAVQGNCDHDVLAGRWQDPYSGATVELDDLKEPAQAQAVQIDHVVALSEAWRSGAWSWNADARRTFANSLDVLVASDGPTNASKSDHDPAGWRPRQEYQCSYARRWVSVKSAWTLGVDDSERRALEEMLDLCD